ncbi:MAG: L,D-transpeptidase, partial [Kamptonema sp. SIO4C4]|nr:L,D-transpeptidase [Kamptonema sp. SIO4C4]
MRFYWLSLLLASFCIGFTLPERASAQPVTLTTFNIPPLGDASQFLPEVQQRRLVLRLRDRRVYYYNGDELLASYPVAIGREGWETPTGEFQVIQKVEHPTWEHPFTGEVISPGPENPLGGEY